MSKKILIIILLMIFLVGCQDVKSSSNDLTESNNIDTVEPLKKDDFIIEYDNIAFTVGDDPKYLFEKIGIGTANEDNNFGFIGWDEKNKNKFFNHGYPEEKPNIFIVTKTSVIEGSSVISQIDISNIGTNRGLRKEDTLNNVLELYGEPNQKINIDEQRYKLVYELEELSLNITINEEEKVSTIQLMLSKYKSEQ